VLEPEETSALCSLLSRHAGQLKCIHLDMDGPCTVESVQTTLESAAAPGGLLNAAQPFAPAPKQLSIRLPPGAPNNLLSSVLTLRDHLEHITFTANNSFTHCGTEIASDLCRLRSLYIWAPLTTQVRFDAGLALLTSLTSLSIGCMGAETVTFEDADDVLSLPRTQLFPTLEEADILVPSLPPPSLARLLPALHHVTQLMLQYNQAPGAIDAINSGMTAFSRLVDLELNEFHSQEPGALYAVPFPNTLQRLRLRVVAHASAAVAVVPASLFVRLTTLTWLSIDHDGSGLIFEDPAEAAAAATAAAAAAAAAPAAEVEEEVRAAARAAAPLALRSVQVNIKKAGAQLLTILPWLHRCPQLQSFELKRGVWRRGAAGGRAAVQQELAAVEAEAALGGTGQPF
jgi:hypothetical protein